MTLAPLRIRQSMLLQAMLPVALALLGSTRVSNVHGFVVVVTTVPIRSSSSSSAFPFLNRKKNEGCRHRPRATSTTIAHTTRTTTTSTSLYNALKPAAIPLMDSGKALARSGELLIDLTSAMDLYGGSLSAVGAQVRNAGDSVAQSAASCRFKTGVELVTDELRESGACLTEAVSKIQTAVAEAQQDKLPLLASNLDSMLDPMQTCAESLEAAGASLLQRQAVTQVGEQITAAGKALEEMSTLIPNLNDDSLGMPNQDGVVSGQRMAYAAEKMQEAGNALQGIPKEKPKGKAWLKGGM